MKPQTLIKLIDRAEADRDDEMAQANAVKRMAQESQNTLSRLQIFHGEFITRAPGTSSKAFSIATLQGRQQFTDAIGNAIGAQQQACNEHEQRSVEAQALLVERQKRLLALQSLHSRQKTAQQVLQVRRDQKESDAWASRATRLQPQGKNK